MKYILPCLFALFLLSNESYAQSLKIYHFDIGQGASTLFVTYDTSNTVAKTLLFDGGLKGKGKRALDFIQDSLKLKKLDYVVASHYDSDHIGGLITVMNAAGPTFRIDSVLDRGLYSVPSTTIYTKYRTAANKFNYAVAKPGKVFHMLDSTILIKCIAADGAVLQNDGTSIDTLINRSSTPNENDLSLVLFVTYGKFRYVNGADIGGVHGSQPGTCDGSFACNFVNVETNVVTNYKPFNSYSVNHHGSRCSSNSDWVTLSQSKVAILSSGKNGRYKHPRQEVLNSLNSATDLNKYYMTSSVNYYKRTLGAKGVLNPHDLRPVTLTVRKSLGGVPITHTAKFEVNGTVY